jgi:hypothetical protein
MDANLIAEKDYRQNDSWGAGGRRINMAEKKNL